MEERQDNKGFRSGFVAIIGRPNVGKSTLLNSIIGEKIAITTHKPQTTRNRILGVHHYEEGQIVYLDTPGIHKAKAGLNKYMLETAISSIADADVVYFMIEVGPKFLNKKDLGEGNKLILKTIGKYQKPCFLIINKVDLVDRKDLLPFVEKIKDAHEFEDIFMISALKNDGVNQLVTQTMNLIPEGPPYYPGDMITDRTMRFLAAEMIREKTLLMLKEEVPYSIGINITRFMEMDEGERYHIEANIYVERNSQKGIVIGKKGQTLKTIGERSRLDMEKYFEVPVGLKLYVKLKKDWTLNPRALSEFGYE